MRLTSLRRSQTANGGVTGPARLDRRTHSLVRRIRSGDIAVIDHVDIDRTAAVALVEAGVRAVINVAPSISGRYPNLGPETLVQAGVLLVDQVGPEVFAAFSDGDWIRVDGENIYRGDDLVASGVLQTPESIASALKSSEAGMASQLEAFSADAVEFLRREQAVLLDGEGVPTATSSIEGRPVVVVVRAFDYKQDLAALTTFLRESSPVLIGVDYGADALLDAGLRPDLVVTDLEQVSDAALRCGAEVVARVPGDHRARGGERMDRLGVSHSTFVTDASSEDAALLIAHANRASLIVMVGSHSSLVEFLDRGRSGMATSFLTRAAVGPTVVHAQAVARLYKHRVSGWLVLLLLLVGAAFVAASIATTPVGQDWLDQLSQWADDLRSWVEGWLP